MKLKKMLMVLSVISLTAGIMGCGEKKETQENTSEPMQQEEAKEETDKEESETEEKTYNVEGSAVISEEVPANQNLLTGLMDLSDEAVGKRPVAVMVNNIFSAMPQYGVGQADIIFEIPVEGDQTRFMALYADYTKVPEICPIRSCRYYFPALSQGFDAFYVNWGIDDTIADYLVSLNLDQIEGITNTGGLFGRDQGKLDQGYPLEHTGFFNGPMLPTYIVNNNLRIELREDKKGPAFSFRGINDFVQADGEACTQLHIDFGAQSSTLTYDAQKQLYLKQINGKPQIDAKTTEQLGFTNVFLLETDISVRDDTGHKQVDWDGSKSSKGYYLSGGTRQQIWWSKEENNEKSYLKFYDKDGSEICLNRGKTYIAMNYRNQAEFR